MAASGVSILIIDDEREPTDLLQRWLEREDYTVLVARTADEGMRLLSQLRPGLVVLDLMRPGLEGLQLCQRIRAASGVPLLVLTTRRETEIKVQALTAGADDYVTEPFELAELLARVQALLRRSTTAGELGQGVSYDDGHLRVDFERHRVWLGGKTIRLSPLEFRMLAYLVQQQGSVVTHNQLLESVWGPHCVYDSSYVKLYIKYLRGKLEPDPRHPRYIRTEWGVGYYFDGPGLHSTTSAASAG